MFQEIKPFDLHISFPRDLSSLVWLVFIVYNTNFDIGRDHHQFIDKNHEKQLLF